MKWAKRFLFLLGIIILICGLVFGYLIFDKYRMRQRLHQAHESYQQGQFAAAVPYLKEVYQKCPRTPEGIQALYLLGECYLNMNELDLARTYWEMLSGLAGAEGYQSQSLFSLALIAKDTAKIPLAVKYYQRLIAEYPQSELVDDALWNLAFIYKDEERLLKAKEILSSIVEQYPSSNLIGAVQKELGEVNVQLLFSATMTPQSIQYIVKQGDSLDAIARKFHTTVPLLKRCNNLKSNFIKPGQPLKVVTGKFSIVVDKSRNTLLLKENEKVLKIYPVGTGAKGSTPVGEFVINNKMINPPWYKSGEGVIPYGDPKNVLGTRWLGLNITGYGIHGTWEPETIGTQSSAGCIRLLNEDIEQLFQIVPVGTPVVVVE